MRSQKIYVTVFKTTHLIDLFIIVVVRVPDTFHIHYRIYNEGIQNHQENDRQKPIDDNLVCECKSFNVHIYYIILCNNLTTCNFLNQLRTHF